MPRISGLPLITVLTAGHYFGVDDGVNPPSRIAPGDVGSYFAGLPVVSSVTTIDKTLVLADASTVIEVDSTSARQITVPTNASVPFPINTVIAIDRVNTGTVTIVGAGGVTVNAVAATIRAQWSGASLRKRGTNLWLLQGDLG